jgi:hypothetical protein
MWGVIKNFSSSSINTGVGALEKKFYKQSHIDSQTINGPITEILFVHVFYRG